MKEKRNEKVDKDDSICIISAIVGGDEFFRLGSTNQQKEKYKKENDCVEDFYARILENGDKIILREIEDNQKHRVSLQDIENGLKICSEKYPDMYDRYINMEDDFWVMETIIECAIFGEVVFN